MRVLTEPYLIKVEESLSEVLTPSNDIISDLDEFINSNSKRIRSAVCLLYLLSNNIKIDNTVINLLTAAELIHNASLLHDDVIDNAEYRRGKESFYKKYNWKISVLSGDYLLSVAVNILMQLNNKNILELFLETTKIMSNAEIKQYLSRNKSIELNDYIDIIKGKTASLFAVILESSSILTNSDRNKAKQFGELFGILYQINNDIQPESHQNDTINGIKTATDILGIEKALILKDNYKQKIREIIQTFKNNQFKKGLEDIVNVL